MSDYTEENGAIHYRPDGRRLTNQQVIGHLESLTTENAQLKARNEALTKIIEEVRSAYPLGSPDVNGMNDALDIIWEAVTRGPDE